MSKRAVILHGTDGNPEINWLPWAKRELESRGFEVFVPLLPENHTPNKAVYEQSIRDSGWDFADNLVIGHSSGATTALNLFASEWFPVVQETILVGTFLNERALEGASWYVPGQFDNLFPTGGFDITAIKQKAGTIHFIHGDNDPYCLLTDTLEFANQTGGEVLVVKEGLHLSSNRSELPELLPFIENI